MQAPIFRRFEQLLGGLVRTFPPRILSIDLYRTGLPITFQDIAPYYESYRTAPAKEHEIDAASWALNRRH